MNNNANSNWLIQVLIIIFSFIGGGAGLKFGNEFASNPIVAVLLMILFALIPIVVGLVGGLWKNLEPDFIVGAGNQIREWFQRRKDAKFIKPYMEYLTYKHHTFDVKGLSIQGENSLALEKVFVDLRIDSSASATANPIPAELKAGGHDIWRYLYSETMTNLVIIGAPGSGKTTLLKHLVLSLVAPNKKKQSRSKLIPKLPVLLFLRDHAQAIADNPLIKLSELILPILESLPEKPPVKFFDEQLKRKCCLIMLDGLDEVSEQHRKKVIDWVEVQMSALGGNRFIITSRPYGYKNNPLGDVNLLEVLPFNREQVDKFVHNWYLATEIMSHHKDDPGVRMEATDGARDLLKRVRSAHDISELAVNPLLLTMIANVHRFRSSLPGRRVELYAEMVEVFLGRRNQAKNIVSALTSSQKTSVLEPLAYEMMLREKRELPQVEILKIIAVPLLNVADDLEPKAFIQHIYDDSGILIEREHEVWGFSHKTFQEYLTATYIKEMNLADELLNHLDEIWWHETIRLYCAREDATAIVKACIASEPIPIGKLVLAIECMEEARSLAPEIRQKLTQIIEQDVESADEERFKVAAEAKLALRLRRLSRHDDDTYVDTSPISLAEYQLFLDAEPNYKPIHWDETYPQKMSQQRKDALKGVSSFGAKKFCEWLTTQDVSGEWVYRLPHQQEISSRVAYWGIEGEKVVLVGQSPIINSFRKWVIGENSSLDHSLLSETIHLPLQDRQFNEQAYLRLNIIVNIKWKLAYALNHGLDLALNLARTRPSAFASSLNRDLDRAARTLNLNRDFNLELAFSLNRARACALALVLNREFDPHLDFYFDRDLNFDLDHLLHRLRDRELDHALEFPLALALARALDSNLVDNFSDELSLANDLQRIVQGTKVVNSATFDLIFMLLIEKDGGLRIPINFVEKCESMGKYIQDLYAKEPKKVRIGNNEKWQNWHDELTKHMEAYAYMAMMERRRRGEWEPTETLWIVRERRKHEDK